MDKIVFVTNNLHKLQEAQHIIGSRFSLISLKDLGIDEQIPEEQDTLEENASQKARYIYRKKNIPCFADDTGLEVEALNGLPGVRSARYAGEGKKDTDNVKKLLEELSDKPNRNAQFRTIMALIIDGEEKHFEGVIKGTITHEPRGSGGFGYDPVFIPQGYTKTFAELDAATKNSISHRALALKKMGAFLQNQKE